jgi:hypothetical protein
MKKIVFMYHIGPHQPLTGEFPCGSKHQVMVNISEMLFSELFDGEYHIGELECPLVCWGHIFKGIFINKDDCVYVCCGSERSQTDNLFLPIKTYLQPPIPFLGEEIS